MFYMVTVVPGYDKLFAVLKRETNEVVMFFYDQAEAYDECSKLNRQIYIRGMASNEC